MRRLGCVERGRACAAVLVAIVAAGAFALSALPVAAGAQSPAARSRVGGLHLGHAVGPAGTGWFDRVFVIVFENKDRSQVLKDPYFAELARRGETFSNYFGVAHPSQPNYIAMVGGDTFVRDDNPHDLAARSLADLIEENGLSWTAYEEGLPKPCYAGKKAGNPRVGQYTRSHNPFVSFDDIRTSPERCGHIVDANRLDGDIAAGALPTFSLYAPNKNHDAHDKPLGDAAHWLRGFLEPKLADTSFIARTLVVVTFDESKNKSDDPKTHPIYTVLLGPMITPSTSDHTRYDHYSLLRTIEDTLGIGTLGRHDQRATPIRH